MNRKIKNTLVLAVILLLIVAAGAVYSYAYQAKDIEAKTKEVEELSSVAYDTETLNGQLEDLKLQAETMDSVLAARKFNIPVNLPQHKFYEFINQVSSTFSPYSFVNVEYREMAKGSHFNHFTYDVSGTATYNDFYALVYAIEQSKELKKVEAVNLDNNVMVDDDGIPHYLVKYKISASAYHSNNDRFASSAYAENNLSPAHQYDVFYPLIRNEIPPNKDGLLDVQNAELLALIPSGAFISDGSGETFLLWEGDPVYLGYVTEINYESKTVTFVLNKGGIIERVNLNIENKIKAEGK